MQKLPTITSLTPEATAAYITRVDAWLSGDRSDLTEGVLLCTAIPQATIFVDYATAYTSEKRRGEIVKYLTPLYQSVTKTPQNKTHKNQTPHPPKGGDISCVSSAVSSNGSPENCLPIHGAGGSSSIHGAGWSSFVTPAGTIYTFSPDGTVTAVGGNRPSHFDEWLHRMPADLQDKIATLKDNFDNLVEYRRKVETLASDPNHSQSDLSRYARLAVAYEARNLNIFAQADICWDELCGRTVSPDLKKELAQEEHKLLKDLQKEGCADAPAHSAHSVSSPVAVHSEAIESPYPSSELTDSQLSTMPIADLLALSPDILPDGPRRYWLKRRSDQAQKYLRDKLPAEPSSAQLDKARQYALDIIAINGKLSKKVAEKMSTLGIELNV